MSSNKYHGNLSTRSGHFAFPTSWLWLYVYQLSASHMIMSCQHPVLHWMFTAPWTPLTPLLLTKSSSASESFPLMGLSSEGINLCPSFPKHPSTDKLRSTSPPAQKRKHPNEGGCLIVKFALWWHATLQLSLKGYIPPFWLQLVNVEMTPCFCSSLLVFWNG